MTAVLLFGVGQVLDNGPYGYYPLSRVRQFFGGSSPGGGGGIAARAGENHDRREPGAGQGTEIGLLPLGKYAKTGPPRAFAAWQTVADRRQAWPLFCRISTDDRSE